MKHISQALAEMLDLPQFRQHACPSLADLQSMIALFPEDRPMRLTHLERVLSLLLAHVPTREDCELTAHLIARTEAEIASLQAKLGVPAAGEVAP